MKTISLIWRYMQKNVLNVRWHRKNVRLECKNDLVGVIIYRFGKDAMIIPADDEHFKINVNVEVSQKFLVWIIRLGEGVKVLTLEHIVEMMRTEGKRIVLQYT